MNDENHPTTTREIICATIMTISMSPRFKNIDLPCNLDRGKDKVKNQINKVLLNQKSKKLPCNPSRYSQCMASSGLQKFQGLHLSSRHNFHVARKEQNFQEGLIKMRRLFYCGLLLRKPATNITQENYCWNVWLAQTFNRTFWSSHWKCTCWVDPLY